MFALGEHFTTFDLLLSAVSTDLQGQHVAHHSPVEVTVESRLKYLEQALGDSEAKQQQERCLCARSTGISWPPMAVTGRSRKCHSFQEQHSF